MTENGIDRDDDPTVGETTRWRQVGQCHYDPSQDGELTTAIVSAVADAEEIPVSEVHTPPLYEVVNVDAVERVLFDHESRPAPGDVAGTVGFRYRSRLVRVRSDGWIMVYEPSEQPQP